MAVIRLYMTMSLDGYIAGPRDGVAAPMGVGGFRLFNWLDRRTDPGPNGTVFTEMIATRAVIAGRRTYEHADRWHGDHHDGVPVFVLTHDVPADPAPGSVRYVTEVRECATRAREAAGDGAVMVHGAGDGGTRAAGHAPALPRPPLLMRIAHRAAVCQHSRDRDQSSGGETHVRSIRNGCSPAAHDRAIEVVATGSARQAIRERRLP